MEQRRCMGCMELYDPGYGVCPHCGYVEGTPADEAVHMAPGTVLEGRYIIGRVLGYGGFGATYIAWDPVLEQKIAIKEYLPSEFSTRMPGEATVTVFGGDRSEQFREGMEKFVEEAKRLSQFRNEAGIVKIFDSFQANSTAYIVMEYLDGETLTAYLEREGTVSEEKVMEMLLPVMQSLQIVHNEGLLHRDIAPDNIFITKEGNVKLIDFGASRYATTSHSRSLTVIIKPGYSPEEQYRSHGDQGPHTDVYALAAVMYKMLTGVTPPDALERRAMIESKNKNILKDIHKLHKDVSPSMQNAILNALNIQISDRTADIAVFLSELQSDKPVKRRYGKLKKIDLYSWPMWAKIVLPSVMIAALVTIGLLVTDVIHVPSFYSNEVLIPDGMVIVPDVEGMDKDDAINEITGAGLIASADGNVSSAYVSVGKIVLQSPYGGKYLAKNEKVSLTVSSGVGVSDVVDGMATVPYIIWDSQSIAVEKLLAAGLATPIVETAYDDNVAEGNVISQSVDAGTKVEEGTQITIVVSLGAKPFEMPDVQGQTKQAAEVALTEKGLGINYTYVTDATVAKDTVLQQDITPGTMVKKGQKVTLTVSTTEETVAVADVTGTLKAAAVSTLEKQGFTVTVLENFDETVEKGYVISQTPIGNTQQIKGTQVTIVVSKGAPMVTVPNVTGKTESAAKTALLDSRFNVEIVYQENAQVATGSVISQSPAAGTPQTKGAKVTLYVSSGEPLFVVPNVVGKTQAQATGELKNAGFAFALTQEYSNTVAAGNVIRQSPVGGTSQKKGATITICVSLGVLNEPTPTQPPAQNYKHYYSDEEYRCYCTEQDTANASVFAEEKGDFYACIGGVLNPEDADDEFTVHYRQDKNTVYMYVYKYRRSDAYCVYEIEHYDDLESIGVAPDYIDYGKVFDDSYNTEAFDKIGFYFSLIEGMNSIDTLEWYVIHENRPRLKHYKETWYDSTVHEKNYNQQTRVNTYDSAGNIIGSTVKEYNSDGKLIEEVVYEYDSAGNAIHTFYEYDSTEKVISSNTYEDLTMDLIQSVKYEYDSNGKLIKKTVHDDFWPKIDQYTVYEYDPDTGTIKSKTVYDAKGNVIG